MASNDRTDGLVGMSAIKVPCAAATTAAITLSAEQTVDGVALVDGDRCLVKDQASSIDNGIYAVSTGTWTRTDDCDGSRDLVKNTLVFVGGGTANSGFWYCSSDDPIVVGTDDIDWAMASSVLAVISAWAQTLVDDTTAAQARGTLGSTTVGDALFITASVAAARTTLGLGSAAIRDVGTGAPDIPLVSDIRGTNEFWVPAGAMTPTVSNGCAPLARTETTSGRPDMVTLDFDQSSDEHAQFLWAMPKSWDTGAVTLEYHWTHSAGTSFGVAWAGQAVQVGNDETIDVAYSSVVMTADTGGTNEDLYITSEISITPAGGGDILRGVWFRVFRDVSDGGDTLDADARLLGVKIRWEKDALNDG